MNEKTLFPGWASGSGKPVLQLNIEPDELAKTYDLVFHREQDDLDWYFGSHILDDEIGPIVFMRHDNNPVAGTVIHVDESIKTKEAIFYITKLLQLDEDCIGWKLED